MNVDTLFYSSKPAMISFTDEATTKKLKKRSSTTSCILDYTSFARVMFYSKDCDLQWVIGIKPYSQSHVQCFVFTTLSIEHTNAILAEMIKGDDDE